MAEQIIVTGKVDVKIQVPGGSLVKLGETMEQTDVQERPFWLNVPGDRHGGSQGPPIEVQWLGSIYSVSLNLSRCDPTHLDTLRKFAVNATQGASLLAEVGSLMLETRSIRVLLHSPARPINFVCCLIREPITFNMGTKFQQTNFTFEAHRAPEGHSSVGVYYNATTS